MNFLLGRCSLRPDRKDFGSATAATKAVASTGPTPGASSSLMLISLDRCQALISRSNSRICPAQLSSECQETRTSYLRNSLVVWIGYDIEQLLDTVTPDRRNDPELGKMGPDCIDYRGLLTKERWAGAGEPQPTLLLG